MNYRKLLKRYIRYIQDAEGSNFIENDRRYVSDVVFSEEEWNELELIDKEIQSENE